MPEGTPNDANFQQDFRALIQKLHQKEIDESAAAARLDGKLEGFTNSLKNENEKTRSFVETETDKVTQSIDSKFAVFEEKFRQLDARTVHLETWREGLSNKLTGAILTIVVTGISATLYYAFTH